ncbi:hypothetical protein [Prevotella sp.]|uniref:hypothetical protein n=1 Tax=Prevotella sp. TaxID=59823 RepID=UPI002F9530D1
MNSEHHTHHHHRHHHHMSEEERQKQWGLSLRHRRKVISNIFFAILCLIAIAVLCYAFYIYKVEPSDTQQFIAV